MEFNFQPELTGRLIHLRALRYDDFPPLFEAAKDPLIWEQHPETNRYRPEVFQKFFERAIQSKATLAVTEIKSGRIIGSSSYYDHSSERSEVHIGYTFLERAFWGGFYNRELKSLMLDHAFHSVKRVIFQVGETNIRSQKALQNIGARLVSRTELPGLDGILRPHLDFAVEK